MFPFYLFRAQYFFFSHFVILTRVNQIHTVKRLNQNTKLWQRRSIFAVLLLFVRSERGEANEVDREKEGREREREQRAHPYLLLLLFLLMFILRCVMQTLM